MVGPTALFIKVIRFLSNLVPGKPYNTLFEIQCRGSSPAGFNPAPPTIYNRERLRLSIPQKA